jgi:hypothetical protein
MLSEQPVCDANGQTARAPSSVRKGWATYLSRPVKILQAPLSHCSTTMSTLVDSTAPPAADAQSSVLSGIAKAGSVPPNDLRRIA